MSEGDQFDAVSEDVLNVTALDAGDVVIFADWNTGGTEFHDEATIVGTGERRMRFLRWAKVFFDSQMNVNFTAFQPQPPALGEFWRLGKFFHAEQGAIELAGILFMAFWHGELHVVKLYERN